jgi:proline iminopeptidase
MDPQHSSREPAPREGYLPVDGASLYYRDIGQGPPIILLHGGPSLNHSYLLPDMDRLADAFRLIYYDQRGRGRSAGNVQPAAVSIQSEIEDLEALRAVLHLEQVAVLGHSWGTLLALEYALRHPQRVSHLILLNTTPVSPDDFKLFAQEREANASDDAELLGVLESRPAFAAGEPEARAAYYRVYFRATLRSPELLDRLIEHLPVGWTKEGVLTAQAVGERLWNEAYESSGYNLLPRLTRLRSPTLILHGDYDFVPVACAAHIAEALPGARLVVLRDCGHFSYLERPDEVHTALGELFQAGEAASHQPADG